MGNFMKFDYECGVAYIDLDNVACVAIVEDSENSFSAQVRLTNVDDTLVFPLCSARKQEIAFENAISERLLGGE